MSAKYYIYVLKYAPVEDSPRNTGWYVGMTNNYDRRIVNHKSGNGAKCLKGKDIIDDFVIGWDDDKEVALEFEKNLTKALAKEYGWGAVKGSGFLMRKTGSLPDVSDFNIGPDMVNALREVNDPELEKVADHGRVVLEITDELEFGTEGEAMEWADRFLPEGTEYTIDYSPFSPVTYISDRDSLEDSN